MIIVFDFDGVLVDTMHEAYASFSAALAEKAYPPIPFNEYFEIRKQGVQAIDYFAQYLLLREGIENTIQNRNRFFEENREKVLALREAYHRHRDAMLEKEFPHNPVYAGVVETLAALKAKGFRMAVVSARDTKSLHRYLEAKKLSGFFEKAIGSSAFFAQSHLLKPLQLDSLGEKDIWFVDDMPEVLESLKGKAHLFHAAWGYGELPENRAVPASGGSPSGVGGITVLKRPGDLLEYAKKALKAIGLHGQSQPPRSS